MIIKKKIDLYIDKEEEVMAMGKKKKKRLKHAFYKFIMPSKNSRLVCLALWLSRPGGRLMIRGSNKFTRNQTVSNNKK